MPTEFAVSARDFVCAVTVLVCLPLLWIKRIVTLVNALDADGLQEVVQILHLVGHLSTLVHLTRLYDVPIIKDTGLVSTLNVILALEMAKDISNSQLTGAPSW